MRNRRNGLIFILLLCSACSNPSDLFTAPLPNKTPASERTASKTDMTLTVSYNAWPGNYPLIVAREKGFFAKRGLTVNCVPYLDTQQQMTNFGAKICDGATLALGSMLEIAGRGSNIAVVLLMNKSDGADAVVAAASVQSISDLKGKRVGTGLGGFGELFVLEMLQRAGMSRSDVLWVNMDGSEIPERIKRGEIDAGGTWEPYVTQAKNLGAYPIYTSHESNLVLDAVAFHKSAIREKNQAVKAFVDGWFEAVAYWLAHQEETSDLLARTLNKPRTECILDGIRLFTREENQRSFQNRTSLESVWGISQRYAEFYASQGNANILTTVDDILDGSFIQ